MSTRPESFRLPFVGTQGRQEIFQIRIATTWNMHVELSFPVIFHTENCAVHSGNLPKFPQFTKRMITYLMVEGIMGIDGIVPKLNEFLMKLNENVK